MIYVFGNYTLDTWCCELQRSGQALTLRPKVFHLLAYLLEQRNRVVSKQELFEHLWPQQMISEATLDSCIAEARHAVGDSGQTQHTIRTRRGHGYRFVAAVEARSQVTTTEVATPTQPVSLHALEPAEIPTAPERSLIADQPDALVPWHASPALPQLPDGERKQITVLACALTQATTLAERLALDAWYSLLRRFFALARRVVQHYEGIIQHVGNGDFLAFFGVPLTHEDHAHRAILAAFDVQRYLRQHRADLGALQEEITVSIGLHSGQAIVGPLSDDTMQTPLPVVGNVTQVAESLRSQAPPGVVLLSDTTRQLVHGTLALHLEGVARAPGTGSRLPLAVYRVLEKPSETPMRHHRQTLSPFVGRQREMMALHELYTEVEHGHGQVVGIIGEPGMGKSRLLDEFRDHVVQRDRPYVAGHCHAYGRATPYLPLREILWNAWDMTEADSTMHISARVDDGLRRVGLTPEQWAPYLLHLLGAPKPVGELAVLSPETLRARTFEALLQVHIHWSRQQPLVLEVENLHWIDPTSEAWLGALVERLAGVPILLLVSYRPGYHPPWIEKSYATQLALRRLPSADSRRVVQAILPPGSVPDALVQRILTKAGGNPFFLEELARTVGEQHDPHPVLTIPDTVQAVLAARIDRLPVATKRLLQVAAVIGKHIPAALLQAIAELPDATYRRSLARLQAAEFLYESRLFPEREYTFKHVLTQEVAYESLLQERRRALHTRIVASLEALMDDRGSPQIERLAYHALHGGVWEKAVQYFRQAGTHAMARSAYREAKVSFEQALQALQHLPPARDTHELDIDLRCELRSALLPLGKSDRMLDHLDAAERIAATLEDSTRLGRISTFLCVHFYLVGAYHQAIAQGQRALTLATTARDVGLRMLATHYLGFIHWAQGAYDQAMNCLQNSLLLLQGEQTRERFGQVALPSTGSRSYLARCHAEVGNFAEGIAMGEEALRIAEASGLPISIVYACVGLSLPLLRQGDELRARVLLERAVGVCQEMDSPLYVLMPAASLGTVYTLLGQVADAIALLEHAVKQFASLSGFWDRRTRRCVCWPSEKPIRKHTLWRKRTTTRSRLSNAPGRTRNEGMKRMP